MVLSGVQGDVPNSPFVAEMIHKSLQFTTHHYIFAYYMRFIQRSLAKSPYHTRKDDCWVVYWKDFEKIFLHITCASFKGLLRNLHITHVRMTAEWYTGKILKRSHLGPNEILSRHLPWRTVAASLWQLYLTSHFIKDYFYCGKKEKTLQSKQKDMRNSFEDE
jgi:hypothetical protein